MDRPTCRCLRSMVFRHTRAHEHAQIDCSTPVLRNQARSRCSPDTIAIYLLQLPARMLHHLALEAYRQEVPPASREKFSSPR